MPKLRLIRNTHATEWSFNDIGDDKADDIIIRIKASLCTGKESNEKEMHKKSTDKKAKEETDD